MNHLSVLSLGCLGLLFLAACKPPGKPDPAEKWLPPAAITDFASLYQTNCAGCHSIDNSPAASQPMNNPLYIRFAGESNIREAIAKGIPGTAMPGFSQEVGGELTEEQIDILVKGILAFSEASKEVIPENLPDYEFREGDVTLGEKTFGVFCASCHGADGAGIEGGAGSIVDPNYLALVSPQGLKTAIVAGRPELGMPDYRHLVPGRVMSNAEIDAVVAWLISQRASTISE